jgi:hypothetical protein
VTHKVIYIAIVRLTDKMAADWHINYLIARGVRVEYWDIVSLVRAEHSERGAIRPSWLHILRSYSELEARLNLPENRGAYYVMLVSFAGALTRVFRLLSRHNCRMVAFASGLLPQDPMVKWRKIIAWLATPRRTVTELANRLRSAGLRKSGLVKPFAITFAAGAVPINGSAFSRRVVPINFFDYDSYMLSKAGGSQRPFSKRYAVFLDSNLPFHSDLPFCGYSHIDPVPYFRSLNRFFGLLEQAHDVQVVIAAHPRADYVDSLFEGRPIWRLETAVLVRDAEFVLAHSSTAISFAVLNAKPLLFIYTADMQTHYERSYVRAMRCYADYLGCAICNVDEVGEGQQISIGAVDRARYDLYKYNFLTSPQSEGTPSEEIVLRELLAAG